LQFRFDDQLIDTNRRELRRGGALVALEPQVFDLLLYLVRNRDRVVSKDNLLEAVWDGRIVSDSALTSRITAVRKAIGDNGEAQRLIRTVPRKGIRFVGNVCEEQTEVVVASPPAPHFSIVVLPFENLSGDPDQEYFADGITDDLTTDLSRISGSFVIARNTAFSYKGKAVNAKKIGRELSVRYVLEGSVHRSSDQIWVNVQLIDAESAAHVWADRFETHRAVLAQVQDEIARRLVRALNIELVKDIGHRIEQEKERDPDARDLVMRAWSWWHRPRSNATVQAAQRAFERALEMEPRSVDAKIGIAMCLITNLLGNYDTGWGGSLRQANARAEQLLLEAIESDPHRPLARSAMGFLRRLQNRLIESRIEFETAIALGANDEWSPGQLGWTLVFLGQPEAGLLEGEKHLRLSPRDPNVWGTYLILSWCRLMLNQVDPAIDLLIKSRAANPRPWFTHFALAAAAGLKGDLDEARTAIAESLKLNPEVDSLERFRARRPWGNSQYWALFAKTAAVGLRRAGLPEQ
jgi:adenylate cyclase